MDPDKRYYWNMSLWFYGTHEEADTYYEWIFDNVTDDLIPDGDTEKPSLEGGSMFPMSDRDEDPEIKKILDYIAQNAKASCGGTIGQMAVDGFAERLMEDIRDGAHL